MFPYVIHILQSTFRSRLFLLEFQLVLNYLLIFTIVTTTTIVVKGEGETMQIKYPDQIIFPSSILETSSDSPSSSSYSEGSQSSSNSKLGKKCLSYDGVVGSCMSSSNCSVFIHFLFQMRSQRILQCGSPSLICCPDVNFQWTTQRTTEEPVLTNSYKIQPPRISSTNYANPKIIENADTGHRDFSNGALSARPFTVPKGEHNGGYDFTREEAQGVCGVLLDEFNEPRLDNESSTNLWPWVVSIGRRHENGTIDWFCLGSLITTEYILTAAHCFQRSPNIVTIGTTLLGRMTVQKGKEVNIHSLATFYTHEKFIAPHMYNNIAIGRLTIPVRVTGEIVPVCFPFLAGVLDITQFVGAKGKTIGFETSANPDDKINFIVEDYRILNNSQCSRVFNVQKVQTIRRFPYGIRSENMCGINKQTAICQAPGAPLVILDGASESYVQIGISSGDPTCSELKRSVVTFTRLNSFSSWVRDRVGQLPNPPPCVF